MKTFATARLPGAGVIVAGLIAFSGAAHAQEPDPQPLTEEYCIYEQLVATDDYAFVAEAYLANDAEDVDMIAAMKDAADSCASLHGMNEGQKSAASEVGIYGAAADYLAEELIMVGVEQDVIDGVFGLVEEISEDDLDAIYEGDWRDDPEVTGRLKAAVLAKGVPDDSVSVENAVRIVELSAFAIDAVVGYMIASVEEDAS